jgi:hypothetical protein
MRPDFVTCRRVEADDGFGITALFLCDEPIAKDEH